MRRFLLYGLGVLFLLIVIGQGAILAIFFLGPRSALDQPSDALTFITDLGTNWLIPVLDKTRPNPEANNSDAVKYIQQVYQSRCEVCHGANGKGQSATGSRMLPRAADLTSARTQDKSDGSLFWIIANGLPHSGMPGWKEVVKEDEMWQLVDYIRALPKGVPAVGPAVVPTSSAANPTTAPTVNASSPAVTPTSSAANPTAAPTVNASSAVVSPTVSAAKPTLSPTSSATQSTIQSTSPMTVTITDYLYFPDTITVTVGTRVVWRALDIDGHTVTSQETPRTLNSATLFPDQTYEFIFTEPGVYSYFCFPHPYMTGVVVVK